MQASDRTEWRRMRRGLWPGSSDDHPAEIDDYFAAEDPGWVALLAETDGDTACGFIEVGLRAYAEGCDSSPVAFIEGWWVDPAFRRQGVGARLVAGAEDWARSQGLTEIASDAEDTNKLSHNAHTALGYEEVERLVCFRKPLAS